MEMRGVREASRDVQRSVPHFQTETQGKNRQTPILRSRDIGRFCEEMRPKSPALLLIFSQCFRPWATNDHDSKR